MPKGKKCVRCCHVGHKVRTFLPFRQTNRTYQTIFLRSHGIPGTADVCVLSDIIHVIRHGLPLRDTSDEYGPYKTLYNRFILWSLMRIFTSIFLELSKTAGNNGKVMIGVTHLKAHRTTASLLEKERFPAPPDAQEGD